ncbi:MAG: hypothetical protein M3Q82_09360, partial [Actinomycetota bacterium]|nr:hypothetical protein [Actinomycetota bacterium]
MLLDQDHGSLLTVVRAISLRRVCEPNAGVRHETPRPARLCPDNLRLKRPVLVLDELVVLKALELERLTRVRLEGGHRGLE